MGRSQTAQISGAMISSNDKSAVENNNGVGGGKEKRRVKKYRADSGCLPAGPLVSDS